MQQNCTPWYFPTQDSPLKVCDPWEAMNFKEIMKNVPDDECNHCLPDCSETQFSSTISVSPFRRCDFRNLGVSSLCNLNDPSLPEPRIWGHQVLEEYKAYGAELPDYVISQVKWHCNLFTN